MSLGERLGGFSVKFFDDFIKNLVAGLIAVDFDEQAEFIIVLEDGSGFLAELFEPSFESFEVFVVEAVAAVV